MRRAVGVGAKGPPLLETGAVFRLGIARACCTAVVSVLVMKVSVGSAPIINVSVGSGGNGASSAGGASTGGPPDFESLKSDLPPARQARRGERAETPGPGPAPAAPRPRERR